MSTIADKFLISAQENYGMNVISVRDWSSWIEEIVADDENAIVKIDDSTESVKTTRLVRFSDGSTITGMHHRGSELVVLTSEKETTRD